MFQLLPFACVMKNVPNCASPVFFPFDAFSCVVSCPFSSFSTILKGNID
jgi:hypothetical protein